MILTGETEVPGEKHYTAGVVDVGMNEYRALLLLLSGTELPLMVESFGLLHFPQSWTQAIQFFLSSFGKCPV